MKPLAWMDMLMIKQMKENRRWSQNFLAGDPVTYRGIIARVVAAPRDYRMVPSGHVPIMEDGKNYFFPVPADELHRL